MINKALIFVKNTLDQNLRNNFELNESVVVLNSLVSGNEEKISKINQNKMVISLINVEQEIQQPFNTRHNSVNKTGYTDVNQAVNFNLDLLFTACFDDYEEALKFLTATISYFRANSSLTSSNSSNIPQGISKLELDMKTINYNETDSLWSAMGAKYQPSIIYKLRLLSVQASGIVKLANPKI
ncbi:MAG: DUF4255 domain-containing protein [Bacteroidales bacterium]|nr:DUF4255 domain-containing protein [Bacteroidales bacterium]